MKQHRLLLSFVGPSGAGKSTCFAYALSLLRLGYQVHRLDVAKPLRMMQAYIYTVFGKNSPGQSDDPVNFKQDGQLLQFLAQHFEADLGAHFLKEFTAIVETEKTSPQPLAIINTDCRNNMYALLVSLGFVFIKIEVEPEILKTRRTRRGDLSPYNIQKAIEQCECIQPAYTIKNNHSLEELEKQVHEIVLKTIV